MNLHVRDETHHWNTSCLVRMRMNQESIQWNGILSNSLQGSKGSKVRITSTLLFGLGLPFTGRRPPQITSIPPFSQNDGIRGVSRRGGKVLASRFRLAPKARRAAETYPRMLVTSIPRKAADTIPLFTSECKGAKLTFNCFPFPFAVKRTVLHLPWCIAIDAENPEGGGASHKGRRVVV